MRVVLLDSRTCRPLPHAAVDVWHCDALGLYSGFTKMDPRGPGGPGGPPPPGFDPQHPGNRTGPPGNMGPPPENHPTDQLTFLRGIQLSAPDGSVAFETIFPGFYMGRTNHIHFKVRLNGSDAGNSYTGGHTSHIGQIFFPESMTAELMRHEPYSRHKIHRTTQHEDGIFEHQGGSTSVATLHPASPGNADAGFHAELIAAVDPTATPRPAHRSMGPPPGPPPGL